MHCLGPGIVLYFISFFVCFWHYFLVFPGHSCTMHPTPSPISSIHIPQTQVMCSNALFGPRYCISFKFSFFVCFWHCLVIFFWPFSHDALNAIFSKSHPHSPGPNNTFKLLFEPRYIYLFIFLLLFLCSSDVWFFLNQLHIRYCCIDYSSYRYDYVSNKMKWWSYWLKPYRTAKTFIL